MSEKIDYSKGIYDARQLGTGRMLVLGLQHMFAMFGATVLVPLLTGLSVSTTLLCAGLGTLLFHLITKGKVPAFLGSSFAYLGGFSIVAPMLADADGNLTVVNTKMLPYACAGVALSGILYLLVSLLISTFGIRRIMKFFPPVVTGPIIISIGLILAPSAITNCESNWLLAFVALGTVIVCNIWGKGMVKILPILIGVLVPMLWLWSLVQSTLRPLLLPTGSASPCTRAPWACLPSTAALSSSAQCSPSFPLRWQP